MASAVQGLRSTPALPSATSVGVLGGGFCSDGGNTGYARHIANLPPTNIHSSGVDAQTLVAMANEQIKQGQSTYQTVGPNTYAHIYPDGGSSGQVSLRASIESSRSSPRSSPRHHSPRMPWGAGPGLQQHQQRLQQSAELYPPGSTMYHVQPLTPAHPAATSQPAAAPGAHHAAGPAGPAQPAAAHQPSPRHPFTHSRPVPVHHARPVYEVLTGAQVAALQAHKHPAPAPIAVHGHTSAPTSDHAVVSSTSQAASKTIPPPNPAAIHVASAAPQPHTALHAQTAPALNAPAYPHASLETEPAAAAPSPGDGYQPPDEAYPPPHAVPSAPASAPGITVALHVPGAEQITQSLNTGNMTARAALEPAPSFSFDSPASAPGVSTAVLSDGSRHTPPLPTSKEPPSPHTQHHPAVVGHPAQYSHEVKDHPLAAPVHAPHLASATPPVPHVTSVAAPAQSHAGPATTQLPETTVQQPWHHPGSLHVEHMHNHVSASQAWSPSDRWQGQAGGMQGPWAGRHPAISSSRGSPRSPKPPAIHALPPGTRLLHGGVYGGQHMVPIAQPPGASTYPMQMAHQQHAYTPSAPIKTAYQHHAYAPSAPAQRPPEGSAQHHHAAYRAADMHEAGRTPQPAMQHMGHVWEGTSPVEDDPHYVRYSSGGWSKRALAGAVSEPRSPGLAHGQVMDERLGPRKTASERQESVTVRRRHHARLMSHRAGLAQDLRTQQAAARFTRAENRRLEQNMAAVAHSAELLAQGFGTAQGVQRDAEALKSHARWLEEYAPLVKDSTLASRTYRTLEDDANTHEVKSADGSLDALLRLLQAVKGEQLCSPGCEQVEHGQVEQWQGNTWTAASGQVPYQYDCVTSKPIPWTAVELLRAELLGELAQQAVDQAAVQAASAPAGNTPAGLRAASQGEAPADTKDKKANSCEGKQEKEKKEKRDKEKGDSSSSEGSSSDSDSGSDKKTVMSAAGHAPAHVRSSPQRPMSDNGSASDQSCTISRPGCTDASGTSSPALEVLVAPYSKLRRPARLCAALDQVLRPPRAGPVAAVYTVAHLPLPSFEGGCKRTAMRLSWGPGARGCQRSKVLRDAEEEMAEKRAKEDTLEEAIEAGEAEGLTEAEVLAERAEEEAEEEKAIKQSAARARHDRKEAQRAAHAPHTQAERRREERLLVREFQEGHDDQDVEVEEGEGEGSQQTTASSLGAVIDKATAQATNAVETPSWGSAEHAGSISTPSGKAKSGPVVQLTEADVYGTYCGTRPLCTTDSTSVTFQQLAYGRTVRDRLLQLELSAADLKARGLYDVIPEGWTRADRMLEEHAEILDNVAERDREERRLAQEAAEKREQEEAEEAALKAKALAKARARAAQEAASMPDDDDDEGKQTRPASKHRAGSPDGHSSGKRPGTP